MTDIQQMGGRFDPPEALGETALLTGSAPVSGLGEYWQTVASYTRGRGRLSCAPGGYQECHNGEEVIEKLAYDPEADLDNSPDSVFCAHGAGFPVKWDQVPEYAHLETGLDLVPGEDDVVPVHQQELRPRGPGGHRPLLHGGQRLRGRRNIHVVYTKEAETADAYIERATYEIARANPDRRVRVATSDRALPPPLSVGPLEDGLEGFLLRL